ncbi:MAG: fumarylacetoacetate hydrolase family protein, partial [Actinomycetota bacterium]|nr:fumarylacetoacetate hydrolase family protein [Actinomycetota bacterium]
MNDFSSRKIQMQEMKLNLGPAQGKDFATSLGPSVLTISGISDQITPTKNGNQYDVELKGFLN